MVKKWYLCVIIHCKEECSSRGCKVQYFFPQNDRASFIHVKNIQQEYTKIHIYIVQLHIYIYINP